MTPYPQILLESAWVASFIPGSQDATLYAMKAFGGYNMPLAVAIAIAGGMLGYALNFTLGVFLSRYRAAMHVSEPMYARAQRVFHKYGIFLLFFCWIFPGNIVVLIAGFLRTSPKITFPLIFAGCALHYGWLLRP